MFPHCKFDEEQNERLKRGPFPKRRESEDKGVVAIVKSVSQLGCVSQDSNAIRKVRFTESTLRQASIREKRGQSLGKNKVVPRQRSPYAPKFEDRSHEETGR